MEVEIKDHNRIPPPSTRHPAPQPPPSSRASHISSCLLYKFIIYLYIHVIHFRPVARGLARSSRRFSVQELLPALTVSLSDTAQHRSHHHEDEEILPRLRRNPLPKAPYSPGDHDPRQQLRTSPHLYREPQQAHLSSDESDEASKVSHEDSESSSHFTPAPPSSKPAPRSGPAPPANPKCRRRVNNELAIVGAVE